MVRSSPRLAFNLRHCPRRRLRAADLDVLESGAAVKTRLVNLTVTIVGIMTMVAALGAPKKW